MPILFYVSKEIQLQNIQTGSFNLFLIWIEILVFVVICMLIIYVFFIKLLCPIKSISTDPGFINRDLESKLLGKYGLSRDLVNRGILTWRDIEHIMTENYFIE